MRCSSHASLVENEHVDHKEPTCDIKIQTPSNIPNECMADESNGMVSKIEGCDAQDLESLALRIMMICVK